MAPSIPSLKPDSERVSGGSGIISELPTLRTLRVMIIAQLYNVIWLWGDSQNPHLQPRIFAAAVGRVLSIATSYQQQQKAPCLPLRARPLLCVRSASTSFTYL